MLILQCGIGLQIQSFDFKNAFAQADIPSGEPVFIEITRDFKSYQEKCGVVISLKKSLYGQSEVSRLWYEKLQNGLLDRIFMVSKVDSCMFMFKTVICVVYVYVNRSLGRAV